MCEYLFKHVLLCSFQQCSEGLVVVVVVFLFWNWFSSSKGQYGGAFRRLMFASSERLWTCCRVPARVSVNSVSCHSVRRESSVQVYSRISVVQCRLVTFWQLFLELRARDSLVGFSSVCEVLGDALAILFTIRCIVGCEIADQNLLAVVSFEGDDWALFSQRCGVFAVWPTEVREFHVSSFHWK